MLDDTVSFGLTGSAPQEFEWLADAIGPAKARGK